MSIKVTRDQDSARFDRWQDYLQQRVKLSPDARLCKVLQTVCGPNIKAKDAALKKDKPWRSFPWLTLALGSGCLDDPNDEAFEPIPFGTRVRRAIEGLSVLDDDDMSDVLRDATRKFKVSERATHFALGLLEDRVLAARVTRKHLREIAAAASATPQPDDDALSAPVARLVVAAHLLTRFFHSASSDGVAPLSRWHQDVAVHAVDDDDDPDVAQLVRLAKHHLKAAEHELLKSDALESVVRLAISTFLDELHSGLDAGGEPEAIRLSVRRLRLLTEVTWYLLTLGAVYPGWSDLLFGLALRDNTPNLDHSRPRFANLREQSVLLPKLLEPHAIAAWNRAGATADFFDAAAELLWAQAEALSDRIASSTASGVPAEKLPPAAAFATSFDLELEMSLLRSAKGRSFFVVIPVHVFAGKDDQNARPCWLRAEIKADSSRDIEGLDELRTPVSWEVISDDYTPYESLAMGPHVVRVSGSPLLNLPRTREELDPVRMGLEELRVSVPLATMSVEHAVTLDEYLAIQQAEAELFLSASKGSDAADKRNRSLPKFLHLSSSTAGEAGHCPRFWMAVGVPIGDPAVRHRFVAQITAGRRIIDDVLPAEADAASGDSSGDPAVDEWKAKAEATAARTAAAVAADDGEEDDDGGSAGDRGTSLGVLVNRRISHDETDLLYWVGFDVVQATASVIVDDLKHYTRHVADGGLASWPADVTRACTLAP